MTTPILISLFSLAVSIAAVFLSYKNNQRFASNQFINKQIDVITDLLKLLHRQDLSIDFIPELTPSGYFALFQYSTLFEIPPTALSQPEKMGDMDEALIVFDGRSNQLLPSKDFIDNPFLPKPIANALLNFYTSRIIDHLKTDLTGQKIILIKTGLLEDGIIGNASSNNPVSVYKESDAFAFNNWSNLCACITNLEKVIVGYLRKYKVREINIRKDKKQLYLA
jgi:hypothetical protein